MKVAKTNDEEITRLNTLLNEIEWLSKEFRSGSDFSDIDWDDYEQLSKLPKDDVEEFLKVLCHTIAGNHFQRILFNCSTLLENCADPNLDYLDFNPDIKAGLELLEKQKKVENLGLPCVSQQRELLYLFITWYNSKPKAQRGEHVCKTDVDEFIKALN